MNILEIRLYNFMTWTGNTKENPTVFKYPYVNWKSFTLFSWKVGSWKSSLAVESVLHPLFNVWREWAKFQEFITTGEKEGYSMVIFEHQGEIYSIKYWKLFNDKNKLENVWEFKKLNSETGDYEAIYNKTPEDVMGISYDLACKTFIIQQGDIDAFSKEEPSKKYEVFANAFWIEHFYRLADLADQEVKILNSKKEELEQNWLTQDELDLINNKELIKKEIEDKRATLKTISTQKESFNKELTILSNKNSLLEQIQIKLNEISTLSQKQHNKEAITKSYNEYKNTEKTKENYEQIKISYDNLKTSYDNEKNNFTNQFNSLNYQLSSLDSNKTSFLSSMNQKKTFLENQLNQFNRDLWEQRVVNNKPRLENEIEKDIKDKQLRLQESNWLLYSFNNQKNEIINQMNQYLDLFKQGVCPTCHSWISEDKINEIKRSNKNRIKEFDLKIVDKTKEISKLNTELKDLEIELLDRRYLNKIEKRKEIEKELELLKPELESKTKEFDTNIATTKNNISYINETWKQRDSNYIQEFNKINYNQEYYYNLINYLNQNKQIIEEYLNLSKIENLLEETTRAKLELLKRLEDNYWFKITTEEILEIESERRKVINAGGELQMKVREIDNRINEMNYDIGNKESSLNRIDALEQKNKESQEKLKEYTDKLMVYKNIGYVFGKKGKPKEILERLIPLVEKTANELLLEMSNWKYILEFVLSKETKDGRETKKNVFDINVKRVWRVLNQSYKTFSGWEKWQINFAIRMWINIIVSNLRKIMLDCVILDEGFWTQDTDETLDNILESIRKISKRFKQFIIISHVDHIKETFKENIINIEKENEVSKVVLY